MELIKGNGKGNTNVEQGEVGVGLDPRPAGRYANQHRVVGNLEELMIDFISVTPWGAFCTSRTFLNYAHARRLAKMLNDTCDAYESQFGNIVDNTNRRVEIPK